MVELVKPVIEKSRTPEKLAKSQVEDINTLGSSALACQINQFGRETEAARKNGEHKITAENQNMEHLYQFSDGRTHDFVSECNDDPQGCTSDTLKGVMVHYISEATPSADIQGWRSWEITGVYELSAENAVVSLRYTDPQGGIMPLDRVIIPRGELVAGFVLAKQSAIVESLPPAEQLLMKQYLALLAGTSTLEDNDSTRKLITDAATAMLPHTVVENLKRNLPAIPEPPKDPFAAVKQWEAIDEIKRGEKPASPSASEVADYEKALVEWQTKAAEGKAEHERFEACFNGNIVATPEALAAYSLPRINEGFDFLQAETKRAQQEVDHYLKQIAMLEEAAGSGKITENVPDPQRPGEFKTIVTEYDKAKAKEELKLLRPKLEFAKREAAEAEALSGGEIPVQAKITEAFTALYNGDFPDSDTNAISEAVASGNIQAFLDYLNRKKQEQFGEKQGALDEKKQAELAKIERVISLISKLKSGGKIAAISMAAFLVISLMQGMGTSNPA